MNHAKAPVEFGFDEPAPFARVPEMLLSDEPWRDSPWDIGAVEHGEQPAVIGGGLSSADGMLCIEVGVERSRPRADSGGRPPRARGASPASARLAGLDKRRVAKSYAPAAGWRGRRLLAVCGRDREAWLDYAGDAESVTRIFVGWAVARGAKLYVDGDDGVCVASGDQDDATVFGVYVVDERALLAATLALPRLCCVAPDALRFDLADVRTSPGVGKAVKRLSGAPKAASVVLPAVLALSAAGRRPAAPAESREDGTRVYCFADCSAAEKDAPRCADDALYGAADGDERLSRGLRADEVEKIGRRAGVDPSPARTRARRLVSRETRSRSQVPTTPRPTDLVEARHKIAARPFAFPLGGDALDPATTALLVVDLQRDFCDEGGYMCAMGRRAASLRLLSGNEPSARLRRRAAPRAAAQGPGGAPRVPRQVDPLLPHAPGLPARPRGSVGLRAAQVQARGRDRGCRGPPRASLRPRRAGQRDRRGRAAPRG